MSKWDKITIFMLVLLLITVAAAFFGLVPGFAVTTTRYAPGFSVADFDRIVPGESEERLLKLLGPPLQRTVLNNGEVRLDYSTHRWAYFYERHMIILLNGNSRTAVRFRDHR